jgi:uncharacterized membrane protein
MSKERLEAFSDGVIAILITIMLQKARQSRLVKEVGRGYHSRKLLL